jgi:hypothetical protein
MVAVALGVVEGHRIFSQFNPTLTARVSLRARSPCPAAFDGGDGAPELRLAGGDWKNGGLVEQRQWNSQKTRGLLISRFRGGGKLLPDGVEDGS